MLSAHRSQCAPSGTRRSRAIVVYLICAALLGCTTLKPVPQATTPDIAIGDYVQVVYADGSKAELRVRSLHAGGFTGDRAKGAAAPVLVEVELADLKSIARVEVSAGRSLVLGIVLWGIIAIVAASAGL